MLKVLLNNKRWHNSLFLYKYASTVPLPDLHLLNEKAEKKIDFLYALRARAPSTAEPRTHGSLAGEPKLMPAAAVQLREDIIEKWDQKPERDIYREMVKRTYTY